MDSCDTKETSDDDEIDVSEITEEITKQVSYNFLLFAISSLLQSNMSYELHFRDSLLLPSLRTSVNTNNDHKYYKSLILLNGTTALKPGI